MTRKWKRQRDGTYKVGRRTYPQLLGTRAQVWHHTAYKTPGMRGLVRDDLVQNNQGRIVSRRRQIIARRERRLDKAGYTCRKGTFGCAKHEGTARRRFRRRRRRAPA